VRQIVKGWLLASTQGRNAAAALSQLQTAIVKGSTCEVVAMGMQAQVDALHRSSGWLLLQVDLKNAFNSIARPEVLKSLERLSTSMMPWVRQAFQPAPLLVGREVIWSTRGVQQGDPLGPFLLAVGIQAALDALLQGGSCTGGTWLMGSFWARWRRSRRCWEPSGRSCPRWGWSSTCGKRRPGARAWCPRRLPSQPRHAFYRRRTRRCWGYRSTLPSTTRRLGPTFER